MSQDDDWVRELLADLDRPAMPEEVARGLDATIAAAAAPHAVPGDAVPVGGPAPAGPTVPAQAGRTTRRHASATRRGLLTLGGVAAAVGLFAMVGPLSQPQDSQDSAGIAAAPRTEDAATGAPAPQTGTAEESAAPNGTSQDGTAENGSPDDAGALGGSAPTGPGPGFQEGSPAADLDRISRAMTASQTPYTRAQLPAQAGQVARTRPAEAPATADDAADWPAATLDDVSACLAALPDGAGDLVFVDLAQFEGRPALVVARSIGDGALEIFVQDVACTATDPAIRFRTTVVP